MRDRVVFNQPMYYCSANIAIRLKPPAQAAGFSLECVEDACVRAYVNRILGNQGVRVRGFTVLKPKHPGQFQFIDVVGGDAGVCRTLITTVVA